MSGHKYKIGQLVSYLSRDATSGVYQVTQLLPPEGEAFQYRAAVADSPWRSADSAPRDGSTFIALDAAIDLVQTASWHKGREMFVDFVGAQIAFTHLMLTLPLPEPMAYEFVCLRPLLGPLICPRQSLLEGLSIDIMTKAGVPGMDTTRDTELHPRRDTTEKRRQAS